MYLLKVLITEPEERCKKPESFCCSICAGVSAKTVLYVCESGHVVCDTCRKSGTFQCIFIIFHYFYLFFYKVKQKVVKFWKWKETSWYPNGYGCLSWTISGVDCDDPMWRLTLILPYRNYLYRKQLSHFKYRLIKINIIFSKNLLQFFI